METKYYINKQTLGLYLLNDITKDAYSQETIDSLVEITEQEYNQVLDNCGRKQIVFSQDDKMSFVDKEPIPISEIQKIYAKEVHNSLNEFANKKGYDSLISACSYLGSGVAKYSTEARICIDARDATWNKFFYLFSTYKKHSDIPELPAFLLLLPELVWIDEE